MNEAPSYRNPELLRRSVCCGAGIGVANAKWWCVACGQQVLRPSDVFHRFSSHPWPPPPSAHLQGHVRRDRTVSEGQGRLL